jgi:hypothetical protein
VAQPTRRHASILAPFLRQVGFSVIEANFGGKPLNDRYRRRANEPPIVKVIERRPSEPPPVSFSDEGNAAAAAQRSAAAAQRSGDFVRVLSKPTQTLAERRLASTNKF